METVCLFCGNDAEWEDGELACLVGGHIALIGSTFEEYEQRVLDYGCKKAKRRLYDLRIARGHSRE